MTDIPASVRKTAQEVIMALLGFSCGSAKAVEIIQNALMDEREKSAKIAESYMGASNIAEAIRTGRIR